MRSRILYRLLWVIPFALVLWGGLFLLDEATQRTQFLAAFEGSNYGDIRTSDEIRHSDRRMSKPAFFITLDPAGWSPRFYAEDHTSLFHRLAPYCADPRTTSTTVDGLLSALKDQRFAAIHQPIQSLFIHGDRRAYREIMNFIDTQDTGLPWFGKPTLSRHLPRLRFHGFDNRFWGFGQSLFGTGTLYSKLDGRPVREKLKYAGGITLFYQTTALLIVFALGMWLGKLLYLRKDTSTRWLRAGLYALYAMPLFWIATVLLFALHNGTGGSASLLLQRSGTGDYVSLLDFFSWENLDLVFWPIVALVLGALAVVAIQMHAALDGAQREKYVLAATIRGQSRYGVMTRHQLPHARFTMLTLLTNALPGLLSGSVVLESIFNIPGMGRLLWRSLHGYDWPVVFSLLFWMVVLSIFAQMLADVLYQNWYPIRHHG